MRNVLMSLVIFSLMVNFSTAIMMDTIPAFSNMDRRMGLDGEDIKNEYDNQRLEDEFGNPVQGYPTVQDSSDINRNTLLDRVGLGALSKFFNVINKYMFGFIDILTALFGTFVPIYIFSALKFMISFMYSIVLIELFTGKRLFQ